MIIMTMWLDFCSIFTIFNYEYFPKFAKLGSKFYQILNKPSKKFQPFKMLVTLRWLVRLPLGWMETLHVDRLKTDSNYEQFGKILKVFGNFSRVNLVFGNICDLFWQILYAVEQILIDGNDQILKKYSRHLVTLSYNHLISSTPSRYCRIVCNKLMVPPYLHLAFKIDWIDPPSALNKNINKMSQITFFIFVKSWSCLV